MTNLILIGVPLVCFVAMLALIYRQVVGEDRELLELMEEHDHFVSRPVGSGERMRPGRGTKTPYDWAA